MTRPDKHLFPSVHRGIVIAAVQLLELEQHPAGKRFSTGDLETLVSEAAAPDVIGDRQQGKGRHYYCAVSPDGTPQQKHPVTGGYRNGRHAAAPSPLTMLEGEYRTALALHRAGRFYPALQSLSRAMHMIADICCPPHSSGLTYFSRYAYHHKRYEARAAELFWGDFGSDPDEYAAARPWAAAAQGFVPYDTYTGLVPHIGEPRSMPGKFTEICNQLSESGADELDAVLGSDPNARDASIRRRVRLAVANCAALLAAFDRDADDNTLAVWEERHPYWLCAAGAKTVISREPLYLSFETDGTVTISTAEQAYLSVSKWGGAALREQTADFITRFRFGFEPLLALYPDGNQNTPLSLWHRALRCRSRQVFPRESDLMSAIGFVLTDQCPNECRFLF